MDLDQTSQNKAASNGYGISYGEDSGLNRKKKCLCHYHDEQHTKE